MTPAASRSLQLFGWVPVSSTCLSHVRKSGRDLDVIFRKTGWKYRYVGAGHLYGALIQAGSIGTFYNNSVKHAGFTALII